MREVKKISDKFLFSVIIAAYNSDLYLKKAVDSIINQSLGFEKNIQIIIVNDGSTDNTEEICLKYRVKILKISNIYQLNLLLVRHMLEIKD